jgi:hypothetical protein
MYFPTLRSMSYRKLYSTDVVGGLLPVEQPRYFVEAIVFAVICSAQYDAQPRDRCGSPRPSRGLVEFNAYPTDPEKRERALLATQAAYGPSNGIRALASETRPSKRYPASRNNAVGLLARFHTAAAAPKTCPSMCAAPLCDACSLTPCSPAASEKNGVN